jgi:hypothetical protein
MTWRHGKSAVVYRGPSAFDGSPIVGIVTGLGSNPARASLNPKTGSMAQLWVMRSDMDPVKAVRTKGDYAVCGDCRLRGWRLGRIQGICYVVVSHAPLAIWTKFRAGGYEEVDPGVVGWRLGELRRAIRLGAYGEVTAMPPWVTMDLVASGAGWTGYTHQWREGRVQPFRKWLMASVESEREAEAARWLGWRTFRIRRKGDPIMGSEVVCPASAEAGHTSTCDRCRLCSGVGQRTRNVVIEAHGQEAGQFIRLEEVRRGEHDTRAVD